MSYSIELYFETGFELKIFQLWSVLESENLPSKFSNLGIRPHLTLAVIDKCNESEVSETLNLLFNKISCFEIDFPVAKELENELV